MLEIAETTMEVVLLKQQRALTSTCTLPRDSDSVNTTADHDDIEMLMRDRLPCWASKVHV